MKMHRKYIRLQDTDTSFDEEELYADTSTDEYGFTPQERQEMDQAAREHLAFLS